jgi:hypothetical protein
MLPRFGKLRVRRTCRQPWSVRGDGSRDEIPSQIDRRDLLADAFAKRSHIQARTSGGRAFMVNVI